MIDIKAKRKAQDLIRKGLSVNEVAEKAGIHRNTVTRIAKELGLSCRHKMQERDKIIAEAYQRGDKFSEIQSSLGVSASVISSALRRSGVSERRNKILSHSEKLKIAEAYRQGEKVSVIAAQYGVDESAPMRIAANFGIKCRRPKCRKLSKHAEHEVIHMYMFTKKTCNEIASLAGVTDRCVYNVLKRHDISTDRMKKAAG